MDTFVGSSKIREVINYAFLVILNKILFPLDLNDQVLTHDDKRCSKSHTSVTMLQCSTLTVKYTNLNMDSVSQIPYCCFALTGSEVLFLTASSFFVFH